MLIGEYKHTLDPKKRLSLPAKFRKEMGKKVVMTHGLDGCLYLYTAKSWEKISREFADRPLLSKEARALNRFFLGGAHEIDVDSAGRMLIPDSLKNFAELRDTVVLAGVSTHVEVWNDTRWEVERTKVEKDADALADKLSGIRVG